MFREQVSENISTEPTTTSDCNIRGDNLVTSLKNAAKKVLGVKKRDKPRDFCNDAEIVKMADERHRLINNLHSSNQSADRSVLRTQINKLKNTITKRLKYLKDQSAEQLAIQITSTDESRRMFEAVKELKNHNNKPSDQSVSVHDDTGCLISSDTAKAAALKTWFECQFTNEHSEPPLAPFIGVPRPLEVPITPAEVAAAARALKNNRATGPDGVQNELLKYGGAAFHTEYSKLINSCFETNTHLRAVGEAVITPLQKPKKPKGPLKNIRPLTLSNSARKILSLITLRRIQHQVDQYTGPWQAAYKQGRSCSDLVWCQRMLVATVLNKPFSFHKMGIDMSAAFDTIKRGTILNLLADAGCSDDEIRLVRFLLSNTKLKVRVNSTVSVEFISTVGSFQGDSLSGSLFTLVLAGALNHLRILIPFRPILPYQPTTLMPLESEYADDVDFLDEEPMHLKFVLSVASNVLKEWSLNINASKTEFVDFYLAKPKSADAKKEPWRQTKLLGSFMCSNYDIEKRCIAGNIAFNNYKNIWLQGHRISITRLIQVYEAMVVSVIMYNCSSWTVKNNSSALKQLDICHRRHLRQILKIRYPNTITNDKLYKVCCTTPLSDRVKIARWKMFGHVLRSPENSPAALSLSFAVGGTPGLKGRRGVHQTNLLTVLQSDIERIHWSDNALLTRKITLESIDDIATLRSVAADRVAWRKLFNYVV